MKKTLGLMTALALAATLLSGCSINGPLPPAGIIVTSVKAPDAASTNAIRNGADMDQISASKRGEATCGSFLSMFSFGNCGLDAAMKDGGITKVHHVDYKKTMFLLGFTHNLTTIVYGE